MTPDRAVVTLTWFEFVGCIAVGTLRFETSNRNRLDHATTYQRTWLERIVDDILGASGERAWCKWRGTYWDGSVDTFHRTPDTHGNVEIRTTQRDDGSLILRDNDDPTRWYVLVTGQPPTLTVRGYIKGTNGRRPEYERNPNGHRLAWFVPQTALTPFTIANPIP